MQLLDQLANEAAAKFQQWAGSVGAVGSAAFGFLADNYMGIAGVGILVSMVVAVHGAWWYGRIKAQQFELNEQQRRINDAKIAAAKQNINHD